MLKLPMVDNVNKVVFVVDNKGGWLQNLKCRLKIILNSQNRLQ